MLVLPPQHHITQHVSTPSPGRDPSLSTVFILSIYACMYGRIWKDGSLYVQRYYMFMYLHKVLAYPVPFIQAAVFHRTTSLHILRYPTLTYLT